MFSKEQFLDAMAGETKICKHLHGKLGDGRLDYKPGEGMRTTLELLQYLSYCAVVPMYAMVNDDWKSSGPRVERASTMTADRFPAAMDSQLAECQEIGAGLSTEELTSREVALPWGERVALGQSLVTLSLGFLTAYRMQLFIYAKASGRPELSTFNCWMGTDAPPSS